MYIYIVIQLSSDCGYQQQTSLEGHQLVVDPSLTPGLPLDSKMDYWLVVSIPLKNMKASWDDDIPNTMGKIKAMFQATDQYIDLLSPIKICPIKKKHMISHYIPSIICVPSHQPDYHRGW